MSARKLKPLNLSFPHGFPREEETFKWDKGELTIAKFAPMVIVGTARGVMTSKVGVFLRDYLSRCLAQRAPDAPKLRLFSDDRLVQRADTDYREMMAVWVKEHKDEIAEINLLTNSRLFTMAVAVGRLVVGGVLDSYHDRIGFDAALVKAMEAEH